jgi:hypothetical protein
MKMAQLKRNAGMVVKLQPAACHLDGFGEALPYRDDDWTIVEVTDDSVVIVSSDLRYRLGTDHIHHFNSDAERSNEGKKYGVLVLTVQLFVESASIRIANTRPGTPIFPSIDRALRARTYLAPYLRRALARQVWVLNRVLPNYGMTSRKSAHCPGDTWLSLLPYPSSEIENAGPFADLAASDLARIGEFFASLHEIKNLLEDFVTTAQSLDEYNVWNVLMHRVEHSLRVGAKAFSAISDDVQLDDASPAGGLLLTNIEKGLASAERSRSAFIARFAAEKASAASARAHSGRLPRTTPAGVPSRRGALA